MTKIGEGGGQQHIVKIRSFLFCIIYYWIWPDQFPTNCWKCPLLFYKGFLYAYKVCKNNNDITFLRLPFLCLSACTPDPQKVTGIIKNARGNVKKKLKVSKPKILPSSAQAKLIQAGLRLALFSVLAGRPAGRPASRPAGQEKFLMSKPKVLVVSNFGKWVYSIITIKLAI